MIIGRIGISTSRIAFNFSNIKPTAFEKAFESFKIMFASPIAVHNKPTKQTLFRTAQQQKLNKSYPKPFKPIPTKNISNEAFIKSQQITKQRNNISQQVQIVDSSQSPQLSLHRILDEKNIGLNLFLNRVYLTTGGSILMSLGTIHFASSIPYFVMNPLLCLGYGGLITIVGMFGAYYIKPHTVIEQQQGYEHIKTRNGILRSSLFAMGWIGLGLFSMPFSNMLSSLMPMLIPNLAAMTIGCFGGASLFIASMPRLPLFSYGGLIGGLMGSVLGMKALNSFNEMVYGAHFVSGLVQTIDMYAGTFLFCFFIIYNTFKAKQAYLNGNSDHLQISIKFYLDILKFIREIYYFIFRKKVD